MTPQRTVAITVLALLHVVVVSLLVHLAFFAAKGPRYTADDGARERTERIAADQELAARVDRLQALLEDTHGL